MDYIGLTIRPEQTIPAEPIYKWQAKECCFYRDYTLEN